MTRIINLDDGWTFNPENSGDKTDIKIRGGWLKQGFDCEAGTYERRIRIPKDEINPAACYLTLGAVNHQAVYYIGPDEDNLTKIHEEITAFTPQAVDLTPHVTPGKEYILRIFVRAWENGRPIAPHWAEWCECIARGIFRSAALHIHPALFIGDVFVQTSTRRKTVSADVTVVNSCGYNIAASITGKIYSYNSESWEYPDIPAIDFNVAAGGTKIIHIPDLPWKAGGGSFWQPNIPYREGYRTQLHILSLRLTGSFPSTRSGIDHQVETRFGFREIWQENDRFVLNGTRINFRGDNLQVANYDRIDMDGKGDAIGTLPGFLPPGPDNPGWPRAVDNFLRMNYNVQRMHMGPWTDYMIDVCDEMGLMLLGESASRWNGFDMEKGRGFHEVKCLEDIVKWHRNHPSIVRWSLKNEAQCMSPDYHAELYNAVKEIDNTRPLFEDFIASDRSDFNPRGVFGNLLDKDDFTYMEHYLSYNEKGEAYFDTINVNDAVVPLPGKPYGITEADWMRSSTPAGLTFFAVTTALARAQGASDIRPYTLLNYWASCIPGVRTTDFLTEENRHPLYGEDNIGERDFWRLPGVTLLQKACAPVFAMDGEFWRMNKKSDAWGHFPVVSPQVMALSKFTRRITVFNDDLSGDDLLLKWELREGSPMNRIWSKGENNLVIQPGERGTAEIVLEAPKFNTYMFLTLKVIKDGLERYDDSLTSFQVIGGKDFRSEFNGEERVFI